MTWEAFEEELWARFGPTDGEDFDEALSRIKQVGSLRDYQSEFEKLGNRVRGWTQKALVGTFMGGLKPEIAEGIRIQLLLLEGPTDFNEITYEEVTEEADAEEVTRENDEPEITLHALIGWSAPRTMRVDAKVGFVNAVVLIDSGSTHNFISTRMADRLRLPVVPTETFTVRVANGARLQCQGKFEKVQVLLQEIPFSLTLYSLPLADLDIVLGVQWLEILGSVICNWQTLTMKFYWKNVARQLQGFCDQPIQAVSLKEISKEFRQGHAVFAICPQSTMQDKEEIQSPVNIVTVLTDPYKKAGKKG
uniref:Retrotransposon gag domain-containing protein n=1 Tax=Populus alba TaxID=43335 RepID=A0A4U5P5P4_POPAL|nr:hypothetical protein D5086_0000222020 [Populus alba]